MAGARGIRAGRAFVELGVDDKTQAALLRTERRLKAMAVTVGAIGAKLLAAGTAATAGFVLAARVFARTGDALDKMSGRTGIGAQALSELGFAAEQSGSSLETLEKGSRNLSRSVLDAQRGLKTATDSFDDLGLSFEKLAELSPEDQLLAVGSALANVEDPARRAALAMKIFGRAGTELLPLFNSGPAGIEALRKQARDFGLTLGRDTAKQAAVLNDAMSLARRSIRAVVVQIGGALAPGLTRVSGYIANAAAHTNRWVRENKGLVVSVAQGAAVTLAAGAALVGLAGLLFVGAKAFGVFAAAWVAGKAAIAGGVAVLGLAKVAVLALLSPIGLVTAALGTLAVVGVARTGVLSGALGAVGERFGSLFDIARETVSGIVTALKAGDVAAAAEVLVAGVNAAFVAGVGGLQQLWIDFKSFIFKLFDDILIGAVRTFGQVKRAKLLAELGTARAIIEIERSDQLNAARKSGDPERIKRAEQNFRDALDIFDKTAKRDLEELDKKNLGLVEGILEERAAAERKRQEKFDAQREAIEQRSAEEFKSATDRLNDAISKANDSLIESQRRIDGAVPDDLGDRFAGLYEILEVPDVETEIRRRAAGIFNIGALGSLIGARSATERSARETEKNTKETVRLLRKMSERRRSVGIQLA